MVTTLLKSTLREIRQSMGRFLAILAIIALGVGFLSGLRMSQPSMLATGVKYLEDHRFHDYRLISTLGFTEEDVDAFAAAEGIEAAQGSVSTEFLWQKTENEQVVLSALSLTEDINTPELLAGRLPAAADECLGDAALFGEGDIGLTIDVSPDNDQDTLDLLVYDQYKVVGIVQSPLYLNYDRGTAGIGNGTIAGYVQLMPEAFDAEAFYEVYLKMEDAPTAYSDEYQAAVDAQKPHVEALLEERADLRYRTLLADAEEKLADAEQELADGWEEYRTERADAEQELADAYRELMDGEQDYKEGVEELADGRKKYEEGLQEYRDGAQQISNGRNKLKKAKKQLEESEAQLEQAEADYQQLEELYWSGDAMAQAIAAQTGMPFTAGGLVQALQNPNYGPMLRPQLEPALEAQGSSVDEFVAGWKAAESQLGAPLNETTLQGVADGLTVGRTQLEQGWKEYNAGMAGIEDGVEELGKAKRKLDDAYQEILDGEQELADGRIELDDGWKEYYDGLAEAEEEFAKAEQELADGEQEIADARLELQDLEMADTYTLTRKENVGYACFDNDTSIIAAVSVVFPLFFFLVAALVCMTTMKRMVDEQRTQIGVLKAIGYSRGQIIGKYLFYSGSAALVGAAIGYALGSRGLPLIIWEIYGIMYAFAPLEAVFDPVLAVISFGAALACSMGATYISARTELTRPAAQLIRPKTPKAGKRIFLERIPFVWSRLSFLRKVSVRNVLRYKSRLVMMLIGIGGCTALLITGFAIRDSVSGVVDAQYDNITLYDYSVSFSEEQTPQGAANLLADLGWQKEDGLLVHSGSTDVYSQSLSKTVYLLVPAEDDLQGFVSLHDLQGNAIPMPQSGQAVLNNGLADALGVEVGDSLHLRSDDLGTVQVEVSGICENYIGNYVFASPQTYRQQLDKEPQYKTLYVKAHEGADHYEESVVLASPEEVGTVTVNAADRVRSAGMLGRLDIIVVVVVVFAAALAFVVLYNLTNISITERVREIATVKVLGFYQNETAAYVFREMVLLCFGGGLLGLLMGKGLHAFVMAQVDVEGMFFPCVVAPASYVISFVLTMVFALLITTGLRGKLKKIDMAESLKSIE